MEILKILEQLDRIERLVRTHKNVLNFEEACDYTGISHSYLYKLTAKGEIPFAKPRGKMIFFSKDQLDEWLMSNQRKSRDEVKTEALNYAFNNRKRF